MSHQPDNLFAGTQVVALVEMRGTNNSLRECFLLQMIFQTSNGSALSQFKKIEQDIRSHSEVPWPELDAWRRELHQDFETALSSTKLPERPDYEKANEFLVKARREAARGVSIDNP